MTALELFDAAYETAVGGQEDLLLLGDENRYAGALGRINRALFDCGLAPVEDLQGEPEGSPALLAAAIDAVAASLAQTRGDETLAARLWERFVFHRRRALAKTDRRRDALPGRGVRT